MTGFRRIPIWQAGLVTMPKVARVLPHLRHYVGRAAIRGVLIPTPGAGVGAAAPGSDRASGNISRPGSDCRARIAGLCGTRAARLRGLRSLGMWIYKASVRLRKRRKSDCIQLQGAWFLTANDDCTCSSTRPEKSSLLNFYRQRVAPHAQGDEWPTPRRDW